MAFAQAANFRQTWSTETTTQFLQALSFTNRFTNGTWDGDAETSDKVFVQRPDYSAIVVTEPALKAAWGVPNEPSARRIAIDIDKPLRAEHMLYVQDELVNVVRNYRARDQAFALNAMAIKHEANVVAEMSTLTAGGNDQSVNGNAGPITNMAFTANATGFSIATGKPTGTSAAKKVAQEWVEGFITDALVKFERRNIHLFMPNMTIGGPSGMFFVVLPIELYVYGLAPVLAAQGTSLEYLRQIIQNLGIFGTSLAGNYRGFDIIVSNALEAPANAGDSWYAYAGSNISMSAPLRRMRNYVRLPANADAERYEFRHQTEGGIQLVNAATLIRGDFESTA